MCLFNLKEKTKINCKNSEDWQLSMLLIVLYDNDDLPILAGQKSIFKNLS